MLVRLFKDQIRAVTDWMRMLKVSKFGKSMPVLDAVLLEVQGDHVSATVTNLAEQVTLTFAMVGVDEAQGTGRLLVEGAEFRTARKAKVTFLSARPGAPGAAAWPQVAMTDTLDEVPCFHDCHGLYPDDFPLFSELPEMLPTWTGSFVAAVGGVEFARSEDENWSALHCVCILGDEGKAVGCDGRRVAVMDTGEFPIKGDFLLPRSAVSRLRRLNPECWVGVSRTKDGTADWLAFDDGHRCYRVKTGTEASTYPNWRKVIPELGNGVSLVRFAPEAAGISARLRALALAIPDMDYTSAGAWLVRTAGDGIALVLVCKGTVMAARMMPTAEVRCAGLGLDDGVPWAVPFSIEFLAAGLGFGCLEWRFDNRYSPCLATGEGRMYCLMPWRADECGAPKDVITAALSADLSTALKAGSVPAAGGQG